jgi:hypothetical protein
MPTLPAFLRAQPSLDSRIHSAVAAAPTGRYGPIERLPAFPAAADGAHEAPCRREVKQRAAVRHLMCRNQMMCGVDSHLNIVADDTGAAAAQRVFTQPGSNPDRLAGACECRHGALEVARTAHGR